jgi:hypothetical protein
MDIYTFLIIGHLIGTVLGVGGATLLEVHLNRALASGTMSEEGRATLMQNTKVLRVGLFLSALTGIGFIILYKFTGQEFRLQNPVFWAKMVIILIILVNAVLLQAHKTSLYWGSAFSFVSWWSVMILGTFLTHGVRYGFFEIIGVYAVMIVAGAYVLHKFRERSKLKHG